MRLAIGESVYDVQVNGASPVTGKTYVKAGYAGIFVYDGTYFQLIGTSGGGHELVNQSGTTMTQEDAMQFLDSFLTDDSLNGRTVVENIKEHTTKADYDNATEDGFHVLDDGNDVPIGEIDEDVVSVTADGNKTYAQLLTELKSVIDKTKLQYYSTIVLDKQTSTDIHNIVYWDADTIVTSCVFTNYAGVTETDTFYFGNSVKYQKTIVGNVTDMSSEQPSNGTVISLHYGSSSGIVELNTEVSYSTAERKIGKWIDGSDLYEKTVSCGALPDSAEKTVAHNISNLKYVVEIKGIAIRETNPIAYPMPFLAIDNLSYGIQLNCGMTNVVITTRSNLSYMYKSYVTLRYVKV